MNAIFDVLFSSNPIQTYSFRSKFTLTHLTQFMTQFQATNCIKMNATELKLVSRIVTVDWLVNVM